MLSIIRHAKRLSPKSGDFGRFFSTSTENFQTMGSEMDDISLLAALKSFQNFIEGIESFLDALAMCEYPVISTNLWPEISLACFIITQDALNFKKKAMEIRYINSPSKLSFVGASLLSSLSRMEK